jgi:hypothetical protein
MKANFSSVIAALAALAAGSATLPINHACAATFAVINTNDADAGSLRQAILQANTDGTADTIEFQITNATRTLTVASALPAIGEPVTLTGATQPGYVSAPIVELNGNNLAADGLRLQTSNSTIRALVINRFYGDGMLDQSEFLAGTLPNDPNSLLRLLPNPTIAGGGVTVQWQSVPGKTYRLQFKNSLTDVAWTNVTGDVPASGATASKVDPTATGQSTRFYRVMLLP